MGICLCCSKESENVVCDSCLPGIDLEKLCEDIINYNVEDGTNAVWNKLASDLEYASRFKDYAFEVASLMESPLREYWQIESLSRNTASVPKQKREWLYENAPVCLNNSAISQERRIRVHGLVLDAAYKDYKWQMAEDMATDLSKYDCKNKYVLYSLGVFYTYTRRYDVAEEILNDGLILCGEDSYKNNIWFLTNYFIMDIQ